MNGILKWMACGLALLTTVPTLAAEKPVRLQSPNGKIELSLTAGEGYLTYSVYREGTCLLKESQIGLTLADGTTWGKDARIRSQKRNCVTEEIVAPLYHTPSFQIAYNEVRLTFKEPYALELRAYNEGVAYRFVTTAKDSLMIKDEVALFNFDKDYLSYLPYTTANEGKDPYAMAFQNYYEKHTLTAQQGDKPAFLPVTIDYANGVKLTLTESDLESYPGMFVRTNGKPQLQGIFAHYPAKMAYYPWRHMSYVAERSELIARTAGKRTFPWRIMAITGQDTEMPVNPLVYALAAPNRIGDCSWVKGGKVAWDWWNDWGLSGVDFKAGINTQTYKYYIDFAAENGLEYIVLDEGWYNPTKGDMLTIVPEIDLPELIRYGKEKNVGVILWTVFSVLDEQLEAACQKYADMGIVGFKVDFLDRDDQTATEMVYRIAEACAKHHLTLDLHGFYKPTGLNRTYPNIINFESVFGMEEMKWSTVEKDMMQYDVELPFIRMMAGPVDYTPGAMRNASKQDFQPVYYNPMSQGTRCHQLATYVVHDSPLTMLADNPTIYRKEQECTSFIASLPNKGIEETRVLQGELGKYIVSARRIGSDWIMGALTNWDPREVTVDFSFLGEGSYDVVLFRDGVNADKQATDYKKENFTVSAKDQRKIRLASGGGFAMSIKKR